MAPVVIEEHHQRRSVVTASPVRISHIGKIRFAKTIPNNLEPFLPKIPPVFYREFLSITPQPFDAVIEYTAIYKETI